MKVLQRPVLIDGMVNSTEFLVNSKTNFVKVVQKQLWFRLPIDAGRQLILLDRDVTYREINRTLGISGTSIHSILHEYFIVKKILFPLGPT